MKGVSSASWPGWLSQALVCLVRQPHVVQDIRGARPLQGDAIYNPFYAAIRMSAELGAEAIVGACVLEPPADSIIILSDWNWSLSKPRRSGCRKWVEEGGRLVIDNLADRSTSKRFEHWSGIGRREQGIRGLTTG
jgi:hypothetical protein